MFNPKSTGFWVLSVWTLLIGILLFFSIRQNQEHYGHIEEEQSNMLYKTHLDYRQWSALHGGVYVRLNERMPANPYLNYIENREIISQQNDTFTLVNPAYMTRQVMELSLKNHGISGRMISLNPINPINRPDSTERIALELFEKGDTVFSQLIKKDSAVFLKYIKPFVTKESCLKCHAHQGYKVGDIRGALSLETPLTHSQLLLKKDNSQTALFYLLVWIVGGGALIWALLKLNHNIKNKIILQHKILQQNEELKLMNEDLSQTNEEVTAQKELIESSRERLNKTLDGFQDGIYVTSPDYTVEYMNKAMSETLGTNKLGEKCYKSVYGFDKKCPWCLFDKLNRDEPQQIYESYNEKLNKHFQVRNTLLNDGSKLTVYYDISEIVRTREALLKSEKQYRLMAENVSDVIWILDIESMEFRYISPAVERLLGYNSNEALNLKADESLSAESFKQLKKILPERIERFIKHPEKSNSYIDEFKQKHKNGKEIWIETSTKFFYTDSAKLQILGVSRNIEKRKMLENEINKKNAHLSDLNATKDKFFNIIAHDLKNPFNTIHGFSDLLLKSGSKFDNEKKTKMLSAINSASQNTYKLLDNLLEWSRSQTGKLSYEPEIILFADLLDETYQMLKESFSAKDIFFDHSISADQYVKADKHMAGTILRNLLSNAVKYTPSGGQIIVHSRAHDTHFLQITVSDSGVGMAQETLDNLFNLHEKISTPGTNNEKGTGLGLILCKEFAEQHGGSIWAESTMGKGSEFSFTLPLGKTANPLSER